MEVQILITLHVLLTWYMVGVIWMVQLIQYPILAKIERHSFYFYYQAYKQRISIVVIPVMLAELATAVLLVAVPLTSSVRLLSIMGLGCLLLIWLSTWFLQVPQHQRLDDGFQANAHTILVKTNWIRTLLWTLRGLLGAAMFLAV